MDNDRLSAALEFGRNRVAQGRKRSVYFIQCNEFVKIGIAWDLSVRISMMRTGCPYELKVLHSYPSEDAVLEEQELHNRFSRFRHRGEWFALPEDVIGEIKRAAGQREPVAGIPRQRPIRKFVPKEERKTKLTGYWLKDAIRSGTATVAE